MAFLNVAQELGVQVLFKFIYQHFLEKLLRTYTVLSLGEQITVSFNNTIFELNVTEIKPDNVCSIVDTDIEVIFDEPLDTTIKRQTSKTVTSSEKICIFNNKQLLQFLMIIFQIHQVNYQMVLLHIKILIEYIINKFRM